MIVSGRIPARTNRGRGSAGGGFRDSVPVTDTPAPAEPGEAPDPGCTPAGPEPAEPLDPGIEITQRSFQVEFEDLTVSAVEGIVQAVCPDQGQLVISADDLRESGTDLTLAVPDEIDISHLEAGDSIIANVDPTPGEDGALSLTGLAGDTGLDDADDEKLAQGDLAG